MPPFGRGSRARGRDGCTAVGNGNESGDSRKEEGTIGSIFPPLQGTSTCFWRKSLCLFKSLQKQSPSIVFGFRKAPPHVFNGAERGAYARQAKITRVPNSPMGLETRRKPKRARARQTTKNYLFCSEVADQVVSYSHEMHHVPWNAKGKYGSKLYAGFGLERAQVISTSSSQQAKIFPPHPNPRYRSRASHIK